MDGWQAAAVIAKAITYGASLAAPGAGLFLVLFGDQLTAEEQDRLIRTGLAGLGLAAIASLVRIPIISGMLGGDLSDLANGTLIAIVIKAGEGSATALRVVGLMAVAIGFFAPRVRFIGIVTGIAFVCVSFALIGHARAVEPRPFGDGLLVIHLLGLTYWIGALYPLWRLTHSPDTARIGVIAGAFGHLALSVVAALVVAGAILLWLLIGDPLTILTSAYGRLVFAKLALVALLLTLAALNKLRLTPRLTAGDVSAATALRRSILAEMLVVGLILLVTATFTTLVGPPTLD
jgi:putative copper resistance protein D